MRFAPAVRVPTRTVRLRLTLLYGALFLVSGAVLLAITYALFQNATSGNTFLFTSRRASPPSQLFPGGVPPNPEQLQAFARAAQPTGQEALSNARHQRAAEQHQLLVQSAIALGIMAIISIALGWLVAGRALRPLRTMTAKTRRISEANLHERLDVRGPTDELKELGDTIDDLLGRLEAAFKA
jgi:methyl-accepting chemotaxis protein